MHTQENRIFAIDTPLGKDVLLLAGFKGEEGISRLFSFELTLFSETRNIAFQDIVGQYATIAVNLADGSRRFINGLVSRFAQSGDDTHEGDLYLTPYTATLVPWFWLLTRTADSRIFQELSVPDIVEKVFKDHGFSDFSLRLQGSYEPREYTVQYRESDFNFISRLLEEEGIYYFFEHEESLHRLILADSPVENKSCPMQTEARYRLSDSERQEEDTIDRLEACKEIQPGKYTLSDYNFKIPNTDLKVTADAKQSLGPGAREIYDYPGDYTKRNIGDQLVNVRMEEEEARITTLSGSSDCRAFVSGVRFRLQDYFRDDMNAKEFVLTSLRHEVDQTDTYLGHSEATEKPYRNHFECIPHEVPFRPQRITPRPVVEGIQTAVVVGPSGEDIYTDEHGRVKVQFHWDREGQNDEDSTCWMRVNQGMAGNQWGALFLPRIGHEVIVDFIEGNPDRPLIIGQLYNGNNKPPYKLPDEKTKSTIKTNSSPQGGGFNEIRFEDKKGDEQIFIHAEKDHEIRTENDRVEWTGNESHMIVKMDQLEKVEGDKHLTVVGDQNEKISGTVSLEAAMDLQEKVGMNHALDAGMEIHLKAGMKVVIEAGTQLSLKAGGSFVDIGPAGVTIQGAMVNLNSGGSAGSGSGSSPEAPLLPREADEAKAGEPIELPPPAAPSAPLPLSPQAQAFKAAAKSGTPFCEP